MQSIYWVAAVAVVCGIQMLMGNHIGQLIQAEALIGVFGLTMIFSAKRHGCKTAVRGLAASFTGNGDGSDELQDFNSDIASLAMLSANIMAVLSLIYVMSLLNDPKRIGIGVAVAFISYVYGALLAGLLPSGPKRRSSPGLSVAELWIPAGVLALLMVLILFAVSGR